MSHMKHFAEEVSVSMGLGGEITPEVLAEADRRMKLKNILRQPLTLEQIKEQAREINARLNAPDGDEFLPVEGTVAIKLDDLINADNDVFSTLVSEALIGRDILCDIRYDLVGCDAAKDELFFHIEGEVSLEDW